MSETIERAVAKKVRNQIKSNLKSGLIGLADEGRLRDALNAAISDLVNLLKSSYATRVIADYEPEERVEKHGAVFVLRSRKIGTAREWEAQATRHTNRLLGIWRELGL